MWWWSRLKERGVIGLNYRNSELIMRYNPRHLFPLVDDKLTTKKLAIGAGIAVPELYRCIETQTQVADFIENSGCADFVIKPARGSGGEGIIVITGGRKRGFQKADGSLITFDETTDHFSRILSGVYSLGGNPDKVLIEYRVRFDPVFEAVSYLGVPDIRVIIYRGVPIMAMLRLPTRTSQGKANLHQGAVGAGLAMSNGLTTFAVYHGKVCDEHPDTGNPISGLLVPHWDRLLQLAAQSYNLTGLGYQGVDLVLDKEKGPLLLELNARPGLAIQLANKTGIMARVWAVDKDESWKGDTASRVARAKELFN
jgi:alpha-L-glutamate ligase-like protein